MHKRWLKLAAQIVTLGLLMFGCAQATDAPTVVIAPQEGPPGTKIQISAGGFDANTDVQIGTGPENAEFAVRQSVQSDAEGQVNAELIIPETAMPGSNWVIVVRAIEPDGDRAVSSDFNVTAGEATDTPEPTETSTSTPEPTATATPTATPDLEATVVISPLSGPPGSEVELTASGFPPNTALEIGAGRADSEYDVIATAESDSDGTLNMVVTMPDYAEVGMPWVIVVTTADHAVKAVSEEFTVTGETTGAPIVTISPDSGPPGTEIQVTASGFPANTEVQVGAGREGSEFGVTKTAQTDAEGRLSTTITLPDFAEVGDPWGVVVRIVERGGAKASSGTFQVTAPGEDSENLFTRTQIYLIAVGDEGESGMEIGCGDSVVPVEVAIEPTIAPLTAGLEKLLAIDEKYYGQSGLYNAFHSSDLTVEGINIENGEAIIRLSGELRIGGVCDEPRIRAQLEQTALQFSTVDRVSIIINGEALETYMGQGGS